MLRKQRNLRIDSKPTFSIATWKCRSFIACGVLFENRAWIWISEDCAEVRLAWNSMLSSAEFRTAIVFDVGKVGVASGSDEVKFQSSSAVDCGARC